MKKQKKQLMLMLAVLVFLVIAYIGIGIYNEKLAEENEVEKIYITNFSSQDICAFSYDYYGSIYSYTKTDDVWTYDKDISIDLDESLIENLLLTAGAITAAEAITDYESIENYGLDEPSKTMEFTLNDGSVITIKSGDYNDMVGYYYLMKEGDDTLYLADSTIMDTFELSYNDLVYEEEETELAEETETINETESIN